MQKEIGEPNTRISQRYITENIRSSRINGILSVRTTAYDFVNDRHFSISSNDFPPPDQQQHVNNTACFANVFDKKKIYDLFIPQYDVEDGLPMHDSIEIIITSIQSNSGIKATYDLHGNLMTFRTEYDFHENQYGRLAMSDEYDSYITIDLVEESRYFITKDVTKIHNGQFRLVTNILDSQSIEIGDYYDVPRKYLTSFPVNNHSDLRAQVLLEMTEKTATLTIENPERVSKIAKFPRTIKKLDLYGLKHAIPEAFVVLPYNEFSITILDYLEPIL